MHLLVRERASLDEASAAEDLGLPPADILFLSFSDSDLAAIAAAPVPPGLRVTIVPLARLGHPMSVDLFAERTVPGSGVVVVRLLGGIGYWRYGAEELAAACAKASVPLAMVAGDRPDDGRLAGLSTVGPAALARLDAMLREGGPVNAARAVRLGLAIGGRLADDGAEALRLPAFGPIDLGVAAPEPAIGRAAIVLYRSHLLADDVAPHTALARALAERGLETRAWFVDSPKSAAASSLAGALREFAPDVVMNATGFSARDAGGVSPLEAPGAPVLQVVLAGTDRAAWTASRRGLTPQDLAMQVVLPELDGRLLTTAIGCKTERAGIRSSEPLAEGVALAADRAAGWVRLARTPRGERRIAIVLSDYPGATGATHAIGYAVGLDTLASLADLLGSLRAAGYDLGGDPPSAEALTRALLAARHRAVTLGRVVVAVQPDRADGPDRKARYHDANAPPCRAYVAFHRWLRRRHAVVHLGTHGTLEWLPGKAAALSAACWPAALLRGTPVIYPFIVNNPGEASVARRRLGAVTIGHLTPPLVAAGLSGEARAVERLIDEYASCDGLDRRRAASLRAEIIERGAASGLLAEAGGSNDEDGLARLDAYLCDVKELRIADGLHVFGRVPAGREALLDALGSAHAAALDASAPGERAALLAALDGRFIEPGPAGAPSRGRADVLPTGRNLAGADPRALPTPSAVRLATRTADALLRRHLQDTGEPLRRLVLDVWGSATIRTGGEDLALAFVLMGAAPLHDDGSGRVSGVELLPLAVLDRPRVDVTLRVSGVFRDAFALQVALFDQAVRLLASRDEAPEDNPLAEAARGLQGPDLRRAIWRVFGPEPGRYGVGSDWLTGSGYAYGLAAEGVAAADSLASLTARADAFVHQQDHRETDILDGPEHAAHEGGFARTARALGASPALYHVDITDAPRVRQVADEIVRVVRGRLANPVWLAGMRRHGYRGASEMARGVEALADFSRVLPDRFDGQFDLVAAALLGDLENDRFLAEANPGALSAIRETLREMLAEGLWRSRRNDVGELLG